MNVCFWRCAGMVAAMLLLAAGGRAFAQVGSTRPAPTKPAELTDEQIEARILASRTAEVTLTVTGPDGKPLADAAVTVRQKRHRFLFGCNAFMLGRCREERLEQAYRKGFADLLNFATLPFYWGSYERTEGRTRYDEMTSAAQWCADQGIRTKGHPLCWHNVVPGWLGAKKAEQIETLQMARIGRDVGGFARRIDTWDVVNEAVVMPRREPGTNPVTKLCNRLGRVELLKRAFAAARKANPKATLILNDFDTSAKYEDLIRQCLDAGVDFDVIGIQSHMHGGYWGAAKTWDVCRRFARFGKPLHFTELTIVSARVKVRGRPQENSQPWTTTPEGEKRQAEEAAEFYRVLFSHPAVEAITWWDFSDLGAWQGAPAGLVRKDMTPKPVYGALMGLVKGEWWTGELSLRTDSAGRVRFRGYLGDYGVTAGGNGGAFELNEKGRAEAAVRLGPGHDGNSRGPATEPAGKPLP